MVRNYVQGQRLAGQRLAGQRIAGRGLAESQRAAQDGLVS